MNNWHNKIETAKRLLLRESEINNKTHTFASLSKDFDLSKDGLMKLFEDSLIKLDNYFLQQGYINEYKRRGRELEAKLHKIRVASMVAVSGHFNTESAHNPFMDKYCGLGKGYYDKLTDKPKIELDILSFQSLAKQDISQKFISFDIEFSPSKIQEFLNEKIGLFIKDELDLTERIDGILGDMLINSSYDKIHRFLGYQIQKEYFAIAIVKETNKGYSANNLKIDYTQIWEKDEMLKVNFIETALAMEKEGLIEIKDIIYQKIPNQAIVMTSDSFWKYPTTIKLKTLPNFNEYYEIVYEKYKSLNDNRQNKITEYSNEDEEKLRSKNKQPTTKIEITSLPELKIKIFDVSTKNAKKSATNNTLYLNNTGDLWREPKNKNCYLMGENSDRHKIVRYLATDRSYQQTSIISSALGGKSEQSIRTEMGKIRRNIAKFLNIKNKGVIESRKESGYRINPKYKIILKNE